MADQFIVISCTIKLNMPAAKISEWKAFPMHEWALAEAVIEYLKERRSKEGWKRVRRLVIGLGELQNVEREVFEFALNSLLEENGLPVDEVGFTVVKASFRCRRCGASWSLSNLDLSDDIREAIHFLPEAVYAFVACPRCGSRDYEIVEGRGLTIEELEVDER